MKSRSTLRTCQALEGLLTRMISILHNEFQMWWDTIFLLPSKGAIRSLFPTPWAHSNVFLVLFRCNSLQFNKLKSKFHAYSV